tara:strand:+ start:1478 stop:2269 length:792 start_codon:yes stop_codon:yes gene_type:complete
MSFLKSIAPIVGGIVGTMTGVGPGIGSGIATLLAGGDIKDAALAGLAGQGVGSLFGSGMQSAAGAAATDEATKRVLADQARMQAGQLGAKDVATKAVTEAAKKGGIFNTGLGLGEVSLIGSLAGSLLGGDDDEDSGPTELESRPDYKGTPIKGLFMDQETGITYDTAEELEEAITKRREQAMMMAGGGIVSLNMGGRIEGPGTGTSDSIKAGIFQNGKKVQEARLSNDEFVMTNKAVKGAGNGDPDLGAERMYAMMDKFERMA